MKSYLASISIIIMRLVEFLRSSAQIERFWDGFFLPTLGFIVLFCEAKHFFFPCLFVLQYLFLVLFLPHELLHSSHLLTYRSLVNFLPVLLCCGSYSLRPERAFLKFFVLHLLAQQSSLKVRLIRHSQ